MMKIILNLIYLIIKKDYYEEEMIKMMNLIVDMTLTSISSKEMNLVIISKLN